VAAGRHGRLGERHPAHRVRPAQREGHLPRQLDGLAVAPQQQPGVEQPVDGRGGVGRAGAGSAGRADPLGRGHRRRLRGRPGSADRRAGGQRLQHAPRLGVDRVDQLGHVDPVQHGGVPAQAAGEARHRLPRGRRHRDGTVVAPHHAAGAQDVDGRLGPSHRHAVAQQPGHPFDGHGRAVGVRDHQCFQHDQGERVQVLAGPHDRRPDAGPGGQHRAVGRRRDGQIRPGS